jgi:leucyl aminopeptidase
VTAVTPVPARRRRPADGDGAGGGGLVTPPRTSVVARGGDPASMLVSAPRADVAAVPVGAGAQPGPGAAAVVAAYGADLAAVIAAERVAGTAAEVVRVPVVAPDGLPGRLLLVGVGAGTPRDLRRAGAALGRAVRGRRGLVTSLGAGAGAEGVRALVEGLLLGPYLPPSAGLRDRQDSRPVGTVELVGDQAAPAVDLGLAHAAATTRARDLSETPSNLKNPGWVAGQAAAVAAGTGLRITIWDESRLAAEGFGGILAVGGGSATPPRLVRLDHRPPGSRGRRPVVLVGKGITYDTGGLSIKPREAMVPMKTDMSGAAAVLAVLAACDALGVRRPVTGLLPLAENAVGAASYRPGDVVTVHGGRTVEILNTDAEGRMVLADALDYARSLDPEVVVDIATLTGAATLGLGRRHAALYATDERLAAGLAAAGAASGELTWRMPLVEEYRPVLDSPVADLRHVPAPGGAPGGGSITAALFLREFAGGVRWAHLDVAGTARSDKDEHEITRGATGYGARLLLRWLEGLR